MKRSIFIVAGLLVQLAIPSLVQADGEEGRLEIDGDFRGRYEGFRFSEDETGTKNEGRSRLRYRFRLNIASKINHYMMAAVRLTTGDQDNRGGNQTLGDPVDFSPSEFDLRRAYLTVYPFKDGKLPGSLSGTWRFDFGRVGNPFLWKKGPDKMVWDGDIALSGASTVFGMTAGESVEIFAATGYYVLQENSSARDPYLVPFQAGVIVGASESIAFGVRGTYYFYDQLNADFIQRAENNGNIPDGLTGSVAGGKLEIVEGQGFLGLSESEAWPVTAFGGLAVNTSATDSDSIPEAGKADMAYNAGLEAGSKKKAVRVGVGAVYIEANALVSQFTDSDYLDGVTNRKGIIFYLQRQILKSTEIGGTLLWSDAINEKLADSVEGSERVRVQVDLTVKF